eukprot:TRINITY_DN232_c0_g1_i3.p1 TRINITY_DN232_c0_g1~~TRINITY_DN232_c0_g1_i3.p1  ORF type:complete len:433 (-),score=55.48 TRINITY_DN232_c0_g1_i3:334-1632(-)
MSPFLGSVFYRDGGTVVVKGVRSACQAAYPGKGPVVSARSQAFGRCEKVGVVRLQKRETAKIRVLGFLGDLSCIFGISINFHKNVILSATRMKGGRPAKKRRTRSVKGRFACEGSLVDATVVSDAHVTSLPSESQRTVSNLTELMENVRTKAITSLKEVLEATLQPKIALRAVRPILVVLHKQAILSGESYDELSKINGFNRCTGVLMSTSPDCNAGCTFYVRRGKGKICDGCRYYARETKEILEEEDETLLSSTCTSISVSGYRTVIKEGLKEGNLNVNTLQSIRAVEVLGVPSVTSHDRCVGITTTYLEFCDSDSFCHMNGEFRSSKCDVYVEICGRRCVSCTRLIESGKKRKARSNSISSDQRKDDDSDDEITAGEGSEDLEVLVRADVSQQNLDVSSENYDACCDMDSKLDDLSALDLLVCILCSAMQ